MNKDKIKSYLGFAIKSGAVIWGYDNILQSKKRKIKLVIVSQSINRTADEKLKFLCEEIGVKRIIVEDSVIIDITHKDNTKAIAVTNASLAEAIISNFN